jgi:hypothetical protein
MDEKSAKQWWKIIKERPFLVIAIFLVAISLSWGVLNFLYSETLSSKNDIINSKQVQIEDKQQQIDDKDSILKEKDDLIDELRHEILKNNIKNNALNISIQNSNIQTTSFGNWSCAEKDIVIDEFAKKITAQDDALILCNENYNSLQTKYTALEKEIPSYSQGFVGKDISVGKGSTFQADGGKFTLSVVDTQSSASISRYQTTFRLNGQGYTKNIGEFIIFSYYGTNYTINLKSTGNPAVFYVYKTEELS